MGIFLHARFIIMYQRAHVTPPADVQVLSDPEFAQDDGYFHSTEEAFDMASHKAVHIIRLLKKMDITTQADKYYFRGLVRTLYYHT